MSDGARAIPLRRRWGAAAVLGVMLASGVARSGPWADALDGASRLVPLASHSLLLDVARLPGGRIVCVGERGHVLISDDGGARFTQRIAPTRATLTRVYFLDDRRGYAVGHDEVILRTTDGGDSWTRVHYEPLRRQPLFDIWFAAQGAGYAVGAYSTMLRSTDFGATWTPVTFEPAARPGTATRKAGPADDADIGVAQPHLYALRAASESRLYIAAEAGHLYRSDDAGLNWAELATPYGGTYFGVLPLGAEALLAYGLRGHLYRSDDAGRSFTALDTGINDLLAAGVRLADGGAVVAGLSGAILVSHDGRHFELHREPDRRGYSGVAATPDAVVLVGEGGVRVLGTATLGKVP